MTDEELVRALSKETAAKQVALGRIEALTEARDTMGHLWAKEAAEKQVALGRIEALTEQLEAARADAKEAEAYAEELEAKLAKAVELLKEARQDLEEYVTHEWPKDEHPVYERKWERDMELCRRIDTTLAEIEGEKT